MHYNKIQTTVLIKVTWKVVKKALNYTFWKKDLLTIHQNWGIHLLLDKTKQISDLNVCQEKEIIQ